jgi:hypothetical protein
VFDKVQMIQIVCFKNFLEMVLWLLCLALEIMLDDHDILHARVVYFLVIAIVTGRDCDTPGRHICPFLLLVTPCLSQKIKPQKLFI